MLFAVGSTLVNCTNSYDVEKPDPQMVELAKYAKQHVPEDHPKVTRLKLLLVLHKRPFFRPVLHQAVFLSLTQDAPSYVEKRLKKLLDAGVVSALVCMVKQESPALTEACRECIARYVKRSCSRCTL